MVSRVNNHSVVGVVYEKQKPIHDNIMWRVMLFYKPIHYIMSFRFKCLILMAQRVNKSNQQLLTVIICGTRGQRKAGQELENDEE